jgi:hypothetical protein
MFPLVTKSRVEFKSNVPPLNEFKFGTRERSIKLIVGNPESSWFLPLLTRFPVPRIRDS